MFVCARDNTINFERVLTIQTESQDFYEFYCCTIYHSAYELHTISSLWQLLLVVNATTVVATYSTAKELTCSLALALNES